MKESPPLNNNDINQQKPIWFSEVLKHFNSPDNNNITRLTFTRIT